MIYLNSQGELYPKVMILNWDAALENFTQENKSDYNFSGAEYKRVEAGLFSRLRNKSFCGLGFLSFSYLVPYKRRFV